MEKGGWKTELLVFAAGGPNIAHCGHLRLHSRAQAFDVCVVYSIAYDYGSTSRAGHGRTTVAITRRLHRHIRRIVMLVFGIF